MIDSRKLRIAQLAKDNTNLSNITGKTIKITINGVLPIVAIKNSSINYSLVLEEVSNPLSNMSNVLTDREYYDEHNEERFTFITSNTSAITKSRVLIYRDNKYNDLLIIPDTDFLGTNTDEDMFSNKHFDIYGYIVGGGMTSKGKTLEANTLSPIDNIMFKLPNVNENISSINRQYLLPGISDNTNNKRYLEIMITGTHNYSTAKSIPLGTIDLGKVDELFIENTLIPLYGIYKESINNFVLKYVGNKKVESTHNLHILLNF